MTDKIVDLIRRFAPTSSRSAEWDFLMAGTGKPQRWHEIEDAYRVLIIADPSAGKTFEGQTCESAPKLGPCWIAPKPLSCLGNRR